MEIYYENTISDNKRLKILFFPAWYPSEKNIVEGVFIREHAKAVSLYTDVIVLKSEGCDKELKKTWQYISDNKEEGIRTIRIKYRKSPIPKTTYFIYLSSLNSALKELIKEGWKPDIIHAHVYSSGVPAVILGKRNNIPVVMTEHSSMFSLQKLGFVDKISVRFAMNNVKIILPVCRVLENSIRSYGINNEFEIVPNAVNTEIFYPKINKKNKEKTILLVAMLSPIKGIPYLLEALAKIMQKRKDFIFNIVGDGPNRLEYIKFAEKLKLTNVIKFHGVKTKPEVADFMRNSDFFVLPSLYENLPCVLIEAMMSGLPIIATSVGGISELINESIGILIPPKDINALERSILYMFDNYQNYSSNIIYNYAKDHYSYEAVGNKINDIYRRIISNKK